MDQRGSTGALAGASILEEAGTVAHRQVEAKKVHRCGQPTQHLRGWRWLNNDPVNFASSIVGSLMAGFLGWLVF